jgi:tetratricopeptide (TPR) repeat protein
MIGPCIRQAAGVRPGEPLPVRQQKLAERVQRHVAAKEVTRVSEFLGELTGTPFGDEPSMQLRAARQDPMLMGDQMRRAWEDWLSAECAAHPVILVLEDLHWGDLPSVKFVDAILRNLRDQPLMVLALARPEIHELFPKMWEGRDLQEVRLGPLTRKASEKLVRQVLGEEVPAETVERLVEQAGGNAFYLEELIRAVAEHDEGKLPDTVLAMVQARLEALDGEARRVLRAASVFGQVFWRGGVSTLLGGEERKVQIDEWLEDLADKELVTKRNEGRFPPEAEYIFRNALLREAAYATLTEGDRALGHRLAGQWLEKAGESEAVTLAEHFERGGEPGRAVASYRRAAEQALEGNDLEAAVTRAERGIACGAQGEARGALRLLQADAHRWRGEFAEMERCALEAMGWLLPGGPLWCGAAAEVAVACRALGERDRLVSLVGELAAAAKSGKVELDATYAIASARVAIQLFLAGRADLAEPLLERVAGAFVTSRDPSVEGWMHQARSFGALFEADPGSYLAECQAAAERFEEAGDLRSVSNARVNLGFAYMELGGFREAERALRDALAAAERMGLHNVVATAKNNLGLALARLGELEEAQRIETQAIEASLAQHDRRMEGASRHYLASILAERGDVALAEEEAMRAAEMLEVAPPLRAHALATLAHIRLARGNAVGARAAAEEALTLLESLGGIEEGESLVRLVHAEALRACGEEVRAREAIVKARGRLHDRAAKIKDATLRASFLEHVPDNKRTISCADEWNAQ